MPRAANPVAKLTCAAPGCRKRFTPVRSTARFCSPSCSQRARRGTKKPAATKSTTAPAAAVDKPEKPDAPKRKTAPARSTAAADNHALVIALRKELEDADALDTFEGQLALELARRLVTPGEGASSLADKVRAARAAALGQVKPGTEPGDDDPKPPAEDEVDKARKAKEAKAAAAAAAASEA